MKLSIENELNNIISVMNGEGAYVKSVYSECMVALESKIMGSVPYDINDDSAIYNDIRRYNEMRNAQMDVLKENISQYPVCAMTEIVKLCRDKLNSFLDYYNIGHINTFELGKNGYFDVKIYISPLRNKDSFSQRKASSKIKKGLQQDILKDKTDIIENKDFGLLMTNSEKNNIFLSEFVKELSGDKLHTCTWSLDDGTQIIRDFSFYLNAISFYEKDINVFLPEVTLKKEDGCINEDERLYIHSELMNMADAVDFVNFLQDAPQNGIKSAQSIIWNTFYNICDILDYHGEMYLKIKDKRDSLKQNSPKEEENVYNSLQVLPALKDYKEFVSKLEDLFAEKIRAYISKMRILEHFAFIELSIIQDRYMHNNTMSDEQFIKIFSTTSDDFDYGVNIIYNEDNINTLKDLLNKYFAGTDIDKIDVNCFEDSYWNRTLSFKTFTLKVKNFPQFVEAICKSK